MDDPFIREHIEGILFVLTEFYFLVAVKSMLNRAEIHTKYRNTAMK